MLTFKVGQNSVHVAGKDRELRALRKALTLKKKNAYWQKYGDGTIRFLGWVSKRFPYGLWPEVKHYLKENRVDYKAYTSRKPLDPLDTDRIGTITLDKNQTTACNRWLHNGGTGIVWGGAGFGKTEIAAALIGQMLKRRLVSRVLFIVNTLDLLDQASERLHARLGLKIGMLGGGAATVKIVTVASIQAIDKQLRDPDFKDSEFAQYLKDVDMIVYDEVHHGRSEQSARLSRACPARYRLGLSARPLYISHDKYLEHNFGNLKAEDARVVAFLGPVVFRVKPSTLIKSGRLARPTIYLYPLNYSDWLNGNDTLEGLKFPEARKRLVINNPIIHHITRRVVTEAAKAGETALIIAGGSKKLGWHVYKELRNAQLNAVYLHGSVKKDFRTRSRHELTNKDLEACVATTIYDEGIDVPNLRLLVLAYGGLSPFKNEQRLGRGLREKLGSNKAVVVGFMHYGNVHLRRHSYATLNQYLEEDQYEIRLVTKNHTPKVVRLVGADSIVYALPDYKLFRRLRNDKRHQQRDQ